MDCLQNPRPKVSIIIPVHNHGQYFEKCLKSLVDQTLKDIEIIVALDCPTDGSDKIAERYAAADTRIKLIYNEENLHTGISRNKGMDVATGEYIGFHDDDDYSEPDMYEQLYLKAKTENREVVRCNFFCVYTSKETDSIEKYNYPEIWENNNWKEVLYEYVCENKISCVLWNHIYKTDFLVKNKLRFEDSRIVCSEDGLFFLEVYRRMREPVGEISGYLYYHIFHASNTGGNYYYRAIRKRILFFDKLYAFLMDNGIDENQAMSFLSENVIRQLYSASRQALLLLPLKKALAEIGKIKESKLMANCINHLYKKEQRMVLLRQKPTVILFSTLAKVMVKIL